MEAQPLASSSTPRPIVSVPLAASKLGRTAGKAHKEQKTAVRRSGLSDALKTPFEKRKEQEAARQAVKDQEKAMKAEKEAEHERSVLRCSVWPRRVADLTQQTVGHQGAEGETGREGEAGADEGEDELEEDTTDEEGQSCQPLGMGAAS